MSVVPDANGRDHRREEEQSDDQTADRCGVVDDDGRGGDTRRGLRGGERSEGARRAGARAAAGAGAARARPERERARRRPAERRKHKDYREEIEMNQPKNSRSYTLLTVAVVLAFALIADAPRLRAQQTSASPSVSATEKPYLFEWVYKVKWGHADEFWQIFKKYQIPVLNRQKELGYVLSYTVYRPGFHTGEDTRWEDRKSTRLNSSHLGISY